MNMTKELIWQGKVVRYDLQRKQVKNINLRIYPDGRVCVSAHPRVPDAAIEQFMLERAEKICRALDRFAAARQNAPAPLTYSDGELLSILGVRYPICVRESKKGSVALENGSLMLHVPNPDDVA